MGGKGGRKTKEGRRGREGRTKLEAQLTWVVPSLLLLPVLPILLLPILLIPLLLMLLLLLISSSVVPLLLRRVGGALPIVRLILLVRVWRLLRVLRLLGGVGAGQGTTRKVSSRGGRVGNEVGLTFVGSWLGGRKGVVDGGEER